MENVILALAEKYAKGVEDFKDYENLEEFYTLGFCSHLAYMLHRYLEKQNKDVSIGFIMESDRGIYKDFVCPGLSIHIGVVYENKFYDIEYLNGLELTEENKKLLLSRHEGVSFHIREGAYHDFDPECFEHVGEYKSFEEIVDSVISKA